MRSPRVLACAYITITSKHHDGFAMWPTHQSHWNIVDATLKQDPLKALAAEAQRQGIKVFSIIRCSIGTTRTIGRSAAPGISLAARSPVISITISTNGRAAHRAVERCLWRDRGYLVRWHVGQAGCGLEARAHLWPHSPPAARNPHWQ